MLLGRPLDLPVISILGPLQLGFIRRAIVKMYYSWLKIRQINEWIFFYNPTLNFREQPCVPLDLNSESSMFRGLCSATYVPATEFAVAEVVYCFGSVSTGTPAKDLDDLPILWEDNFYAVVAVHTKKSFLTSVATQTQPIDCDVIYSRKLLLIHKIQIMMPHWSKITQK